MIFLIQSLAVFSGLRAVSAQSSITGSHLESTVGIFPTGVSRGSSQSESTLPLACAQGCLAVTGPYSACFINTTKTEERDTSQEECDDFFCSQGNYTQLLDCANCIVANGDERPFGYHTNSALTAAPTENNGIGLPVNPLGLVDREQLNGWLANVTERCSSINKPVTGSSSVTATPTTTGPYFASFKPGETISIPVWTGLSQYPPPILTYYVPDGLGTSASSSSAGSSNSNSGNGSPTSSAVQSSAGGADNGALRRDGSAEMTVLGMIVAAYIVVQLR